MSPDITIHVVAYRGEERWIAQCVEFDIAAFADDVNGLEAAFSKALAANLCINQQLGRNLLDGIPAAPNKFRTMFEAARDRVPGKTDGPKASPHLRIEEMRLVH